MDQTYLCPRCGEPMRTHRIACWLRLVQPTVPNPAPLYFHCRGCGAPFVLPRDTPLAAA